MKSQGIVTLASITGTLGNLFLSIKTSDATRSHPFYETAAGVGAPTTSPAVFASSERSSFFFF